MAPGGQLGFGRFDEGATVSLPPMIGMDVDGIDLGPALSIGLPGEAEPGELTFRVRDQEKSPPGYGGGKEPPPLLHVHAGEELWGEVVPVGFLPRADVKLGQCRRVRDLRPTDHLPQGSDGFA